MNFLLRIENYIRAEAPAYHLLTSEIQYYTGSFYGRVLFNAISFSRTDDIV